MSNIDLAYYAQNFQVSFLIMNFVAGLYYIVTRSISWSSFSEATFMERQGTLLLFFCLAISFINAIEFGDAGHIFGWLLVMILEFLMGIFIGLIFNQYYRLQ